MQTKEIPGGQPGARSNTSIGAATARSRTLVSIGIVASLLHAAFDAVTAQVPLLVPPYLRLADAPEEFRMLSPLAVSIAVSCVSGIIAVISVAAVLPSQRRTPVLAGMITGFWLFSAILLRIVWLSTPWGATVVALVPGIVRGAVIGWAAAAIANRRVTATTGGAA
jgi:hypothetical protein